MSFNPRNLISQQEIVDSLNSTSTLNPLSANQGFVLNNKIVDIETELGQIINRSVFPFGDQVIIGLNNIGQLNWDNTNNQVTLSLTNTTISNFTVYNRTIQYNGINFFEITDNGFFNVNDGNTYYFSDDGLVNTNFDMGDATRTSVAIFMEGSGNNPPYNLSLDIIRSSSGSVVTVNGRLNTVSAALTLEGISMRCEASDSLNGNTSGPLFPCSWGDGEQNNATGSGPLMPEKVLFTDFSIDLNGDNAATDITFALYENGVQISNTEMTITAGNDFVTGSFSVPATIESGKRLDIGIPLGDGDTTYYVADLVLYGTIEEIG